MPSESAAMILLDTKQAAEFLGLQPSTLVDWRWQHKGPPWIPISRGCVRYDRAALEVWLKAREVEAIPEAS